MDVPNGLTPPDTSWIRPAILDALAKLDQLGPLFEAPREVTENGPLLTADEKLLLAELQCSIEPLSFFLSAEELAPLGINPSQPIDRFEWETNLKALKGALRDLFWDFPKVAKHRGAPSHPRLDEAIKAAERGESWSAIAKILDTTPNNAWTRVIKAAATRGIKLQARRSNNSK